MGSRDVTADRIDAALGARVALRYRIGEREGRPLFTDAVGVLSDGGPGQVVVDTRQGAVRVDRDTVVALRVVPPAPPRRASWSAVTRLEALCADAWPAQVDEPLGGWRLRAAEGHSGRANSALAIGDPGLPTPAALARVEEFAAAHGISPRVQAPIGSPWSRAVEREGWVIDPGRGPDPQATMLVAELTSAAPAGADVELSPAPSDDWWAVHGDPTSEGERHVLTAAARPVFAVARRGGRPVGILRGAVVEDHLYLARLRTRPEARRTGVASALTAAVARWGVEHGAHFGMLQVARDNTGARAFYARSGWTEHHRYHYLVPA